jgi:hypothetical protein
MVQKRTIKTDALEKQIAGQKESEKRENREHWMLSLVAVLLIGLLYLAMSGVGGSPKPNPSGVTNSKGGTPSAKNTGQQ